MKSAIVTGAAGGIGIATCAALAAAGYRVGLLDREAEATEAAARGIAGSVPLVADITDEAAVASAIAAFGDAPDLLVNNAGIVRKGSLLDQPVADFRAVMEINLIGALIVSRAVVPGMIRRGGGAVVNVSSIAAVQANVGGGAYGPSKAALFNLTQVMALEWAAHGIRVNAVAPGMIDGGMATAGAAHPEVVDARRRMVPLATLGTPAEIADVVLFLGSDAARYVTGQQLLVDGGLGRSVLASLPMPPADGG
ncbi:SDR family NAD(P)-dependent oxidoreductase [Sphingomonas sp. 1P06PA]|uniref:SDR family NAD(P)-dependent oxidoreductase n=1 Tax=Sphingomonas sp. 1P06PA TaxID=554121 RepID=UPI0039A41367